MTRARIMRAREDREVAWPADQVERWPIDRLRLVMRLQNLGYAVEITPLAA